MSEDLKAIARRTIDVYARGDIELVDELYAPDYVDHSPGNPPGLASGPEGVKQFVAMFRDAFPEGDATADDVIAEGDKVAVRWSGRGTHEGDFMGIPASGKHVSFSGTTIYRIADGKIAEEWTHADYLGLLTQIGAVPDVAQATEAS